MRKNIFIMCVFLSAALIMTACGSVQPSNYMSGGSQEQKVLPRVSEHKSETKLQEQILASYYAGQSTSAFEYFQYKRIQEFLAMWVKEETEGEIVKPVWNLDSFTKLSVFDHDFIQSRPEEQLYSCTFSDGGDRRGYVIVRYDEKGPALGNWSVVETTPDVYDLRENVKEICAALEKTDADLSTVTASRIYFFDREKIRADQVIRFTDGKGDNYLYYFGDPSFEIVKWK